MNCEKSRKRDLLRMWGMKALGNGMSFEDVIKKMNSMMKKTLKEIEEFIKDQNNA